MSFIPAKRALIAACGCMLLLFAGPLGAQEKLTVFILAGQSNTVGHARGHTIATLFKEGREGDAELANMVFKNGAEINAAFDEQIERARQLDAISGGISMAKLKGMPDGPEKAALQAQIDEMVAKHEAYQQRVIDAATVSDRVYVTAIADRNVRQGKLAIGYGADKTKIGPEYGFGLAMAKKIGGPILLIKTSWGGKSLTYDFRPPSAPDFKTTKAYADIMASAAKNQQRFEENKQKFPEAEKQYVADLAAYKEKLKTADEKTRKKLREPKKPRPPRPPREPNVDNAGHFWREMVKHVNQVLAAPGDYHPAYDADKGYEIGGLVWFQGYNDQFNPEFHGHYTENMRLFIQDARKTFKTPEMPVVIGILGTGKTKEKVDENAVSQAQRAAARLPDLAATVRAVESYPLYSHYADGVFAKGWPEHFHEWSTVGSDRPYHYLGSGAFFVRLGNAFAQSMAELRRNQ